MSVEATWCHLRENRCCMGPQDTWSDTETNKERKQVLYGTSNHMVRHRNKEREKTGAVWDLKTHGQTQKQIKKENRCCQTQKQRKRENQILVNATHRSILPHNTPHTLWLCLMTHSPVVVQIAACHLLSDPMDKSAALGGSNYNRISTLQSMHTATIYRCYQYATLQTHEINSTAYTTNHIKLDSLNKSLHVIQPTTACNINLALLVTVQQTRHNVGTRHVSLVWLHI